MMRTSERGRFELAGHEAVVTGPYKDSQGYWTFGVGHTAAAGKPDPAKMSKLQQQDFSYVMQVFAADLEKYEREVNAAFTVQLTQEQFDAAVSFHFNTGGIKRAYWVRLVNMGRMKEARQKFMNWSKPPEIIKRREEECKLFFDGVYSRVTVPVYKAVNGIVDWSHSTSLPLSAGLPRLAPLPVDSGNPSSSGSAHAQPFWSKLWCTLKGKTNG